MVICINLGEIENSTKPISRPSTARPLYFQNKGQKTGFFLILCFLLVIMTIRDIRGRSEQDLLFLVKRILGNQARYGLFL